MTRRLPEWMAIPLSAIGLKLHDVEKLYNDVHYESVHLVQMLEKLYLANALLLDVQDGPFQEKQELTVRGVLMRIKYVQHRRLVLELPPGRVFKK